VSNANLQSLWGKLLAGEIKSPGAYSLRTIDFLRNLSSQDAKNIEKLFPFVINGCIFNGAEELLLEEGLSYSFFLEMQQLGILSGVEALQMSTSYDLPPPNYQFALTSHMFALIIKGNDSLRTFHLNIYSLTEIGKQLLMLGKFQPNIDYLKIAGISIKEQGFEVEIAEYTCYAHNQLKCFNNLKL
nr:DUF2806 domain-containing protein [Nitrosomonas sp.]